jgi:hypothetical protein
VFALEYEPGADGLQEDLSATADGALALLDAGMDAACRYRLVEDSQGVSSAKLCKFMNLPESTMESIRSAVDICSNHSRYRFYEVSGHVQGVEPTASSGETWFIGPASDDSQIRSEFEVSAFAEQTSGEAILSLPMYEQLLHVVCSANGGLGVTAKDIASLLGISYKRAAKHVKELVSSYGFNQETVLVKKAMMIKVLSPHWDVIADGGINIVPSTIASRSGDSTLTIVDSGIPSSAPTRSSSSSSSSTATAVVAATAAAAAPEQAVLAEDGAMVVRSRLPASKLVDSTSNLDRSAGI